MTVLRTRLDRHGRIVLPAVVRRRLGVGPGDELVLDVREDEVRLSTHEKALKGLQRLVRDHLPPGGYSVGTFLAEKRVDLQDEERALGTRRGHRQKPNRP